MTIQKADRRALNKIEKEKLKAEKRKRDNNNTKKTHENFT